MFKSDNLGNRMKKNYESRTKYLLPLRTYTVIRIDGKAFHTYTKGLERPFDKGFVEDMNHTTQYLCQNIQGCKFGFVQSDEISLVLSDFETHETQAWFDGEVQKIVSISASYATSFFNYIRLQRYFYDNKVGEHFTEPLDGETYEIQLGNVINYFPLNNKLAHFDSRVFTIPSKTEVENYLIWRQQDCTRNSISSVAQSLYSTKELHEKNQSDMQEMIFQKGQNWNSYDEGLKRGRMCIKVSEELSLGNFRTKWVIDSAPIFTKERELLSSFIPTLD